MQIVFIESFTTSAWQSNCYVIAKNASAPCVIVDPGPQAFDRLRVLLERYGLTPEAVLLTHGHYDHVGDAAAVADHFDIPAWIHPADRHLLTDPLAGIGRDRAPMLAQMMGTTDLTLPAPRTVHELADADDLELAGLHFATMRAPGHTEGCVLTEFASDDGERLCLTGDVLFAGSIGRTDLPGGDDAAMQQTLAHIVGALNPDVKVFPGHGPASTMARELAGNPYLRAAIASHG